MMGAQMADDRGMEQWQMMILTDSSIKLGNCESSFPSPTQATFPFMDDDGDDGDGVPVQRFQRWWHPRVLSLVQDG